MDNKKNIMPAAIIDGVELDCVGQTLSKVARFQAVMQGALKKGHDVDTIPGTNKPTLLKPGAEKVLMLLGLTSEYEVIEKIEDWGNGVFAYTVRCIISKSGQKVTEGLGHCNGREDKYRYRWVYENEVPEELDKQALKTNRYGKYRIPNDEIYSLVNTILKMAKKRAQVDAVLTVAALSEVFAQDLEDMKEHIQSEQLDNMTIEDAGKVVVNFGKYKGKTLGEISTQDASYMNWLVEKSQNEAVRKAAAMILQSGSKTKTKSAAVAPKMELDDNVVPF